jgi:squalene cyclase
MRSLFVFAACLTIAQAAPAQQAGRDRLDRSIEQALGFLRSTQQPDGAWHAFNRSPAVTALAVMAFLSAGHVPGEGPYGDTVEKGIRWVLRAQLTNGVIASNTGHEMYEHGICTLMLAEVAGMTDGKLGQEVRQRLEKAVKIILQAQRTNGHFRGGWRYRVNSYDADMSVTGWQLLALRAAKNLGCDIPPERIDMAVDYILRSQEPKTGAFCYQPGGRDPTVPCTGTGILGLEICGKGRHHTPEALQAGDFLLKNPPRWGDHYHFFYSIYYCSQATFQLGNNYWSYFRPKLHKVLLDNQESNGSWTGSDGYGPNYGTAMAVLALTVEYRYLPIYQRSEEPEERPR